MALVSLKSLRRTNPEVGVCVVTNQIRTPPKIDGWSDSRDKWIFVEGGNNSNRLFKTSIFEFSPFSKTLYLDCDTVVVGSLSEMSFYLDYFDVAARSGRSPGPTLDRDKILMDGRKRFSNLCFWNGGVVGFRKNDQAGDFFREWNSCYKNLGFKRDQPALVEAVFRSKCRFLTLDPKWNNGDGLNSDGLLGPKEVRDLCIIWHYKSDIDRKLRREIISASNGLFGKGDAEVVNFLKKNSRCGANLVRPRLFFRRIVRAVRGRLPERQLS